MSVVGGLHNFRDTGGTALRAGGETRAGVLYRSDALGTLTDAGLEVFAETPIGVVVDFRTPHERAALPDRLPAAPTAPSTCRSSRERWASWRNRSWHPVLR